MSKGKQRDPGREQYWRRLLAQRQRSGLSVRAFCQLHGLSEPRFYVWRRTLAVRDAAAVHFAPVRIVPDPTPETAADSDRTGLELVLGTGRRLRVGVGFDGPTLQRLLALLEEGRP
jgi:transposase-like protein